jgi:hypothetical protein
MSFYPERSQVVAAKKHTDPAIDPVPTVSANAIWIETPASTVDPQTTTTNEVGGSLDAPADIPAGGTTQFRGRVNAKGSGTPTTAPDWSVMHEGCGFEVQSVGAAITGTATAGATRSITLAGGASAVTDFYKGMVITTTGGTGSGQSRIISSYNGSTKVATVYPAFSPAPDATTGYSIPAGFLYKLTSSNLALVAIYHYQNRNDGGNSKLRKTLAAAGNVTITLAPRAAAQFDYEFRGGLNQPVDVSAPGAPTILNRSSLPWLGGTAYFGDTKAAISQLTVNLENQVTVEEDPNEPSGYGTAGITGRRVGGTLRLPQQLESSLNAYNSWLNSSEQPPITATWGSVAGNRLAFLVERTVFSGPGTVEGVNGFIHNSLTYRSAGEDAGIRIYVY